VDCFLAGRIKVTDHLALEVELRKGRAEYRKRKSALLPPLPAESIASNDPVTSAPVHASSETTTDPARYTVSLNDLSSIDLWDLDEPHLLYRPCTIAAIRSCY